MVLRVDPDLNVDGNVQKVLLRDMQRHPFKQQIMHLDFQRVDENEAIRFNVPLHFLNQEKSPAGKTADVVVTHELQRSRSQLPAARTCRSSSRSTWSS